MIEEVSDFLRRTIVLGLAAFAFSGGHAEETHNIPTIGEVWLGDPASVKVYDQAFRTALRSLGYVEGQNVRIVANYANGDAKQLPALIKELLASHADILLVSARAVRAAKEITRTVPIVCPSMGNPLKDGLVASLAQPGGNVTGLYAQANETQSKRLEFAIELIPGLKEIGVLFDASDPIVAGYADDLRILARKVGVTARMLGVQTPQAIRETAAAVDKNPPQALVVLNTPFTNMHREAIMRPLAHRLPVIGEGRDYAVAGAVLTYAPDFVEMVRRSATYVDRILKGADPGSLPIEQPEKFQLIVNVKAAKTHRLKVSESILLRADEIIR
jgi:putative tryptophan/tyrosine transport system substrate-binding protein